MRRSGKLSELQKVCLDYGRAYREAACTYTLILLLRKQGFDEVAGYVEDARLLATKTARQQYNEKRHALLLKKAGDSNHG